MPLRGSTFAVVGVVCALVLAGSDAASQTLSPRLFSAVQAIQPIRIMAADFGGLHQPDRTRPPSSFVLDVSPQQAPAPPTPEHTGFQALVRTTGADFVAFPKRKSTWVILAIGGGAAAAAHPLDHSLNARLVGNPTASRIFAPGKYIGLGWVQASAAVGTYLVGRYMLDPDPALGPHTNKVAHIGFDLLRAQIVAQTLTQGIKVAVQRDRPDGTCCAFPSGHASTTFATAAVLERHLGVRAAWPTMLIASYVAASRLHDNRHYLSDVVFGAALGTASGWTVVGRHGRSHYTLLPVPMKGGAAITFMRVPEAGAGVGHN
jgi:membrane-associated phospholipid phosphatase